MFLLDTCVISDFFKKEENTIEHFKSHSPDALGVSTISVMEIEYGLAINPERAIKLKPLWLALIHQINIISFNSEDVIAAANIRAHLKNIGKPIDPYDVLLAGTAVNRNFIIVTSNTDELIESLV